jgi:hypothetical protein
LGQGLSPTTKKPLPWHLSQRFIFRRKASWEFIALGNEKSNPFSERNNSLKICKKDLAGESQIEIEMKMEMI